MADSRINLNSYKKRYLVTAFLLLGCASILSAEILKRDDLQKKLSPLACSSTPSITTVLWQNGVFETQIKFSQLTPKKLPVKDDLLTTKAREMAHRLNHQGFAYGQCQDNLYWMATMPAPLSFKRDKGKIIFKTAAMAPFCRAVKISFSGAKGGLSKVIAYSKIVKGMPNLNVHTQHLHDGTLAFICQPKQEAHADTLWHLLPVHSLQHDHLPFPGLLQGENTRQQIVKWINAIRIDHLLAPLVVDESILGAPPPQNHVNHEIKKLQLYKQILAQKGQLLVGENRVIGQTLEEMAWMLWNSPSHRDLLLTPKADQLSVAIDHFTPQQKSVALYFHANKKKKM